MTFHFFIRGKESLSQWLNAQLVAISNLLHYVYVQLLGIQPWNQEQSEIGNP